MEIVEKRAFEGLSLIDAFGVQMEPDDMDRLLNCLEMLDAIWRP